MTDVRGLSTRGWQEATLLGGVPVPLSAVRVGDVVVVKAGEAVPVDGDVVGGRASVDESALTGEECPLEKKVGDAVYG